MTTGGGGREYVIPPEFSKPPPARPQSGIPGGLLPPKFSIEDGVIFNDKDLDAIIKFGGYTRPFEPGYTLSYKREWNEPWYIVREIFQNALDEHDIIGRSITIGYDTNNEPAQFTYPPTMRVGQYGLVIEDVGRGVGAENLLLGEEEKHGKALRGTFGEGMKFACVAAIRMGFIPWVVSPRTEFICVGHRTTFGQSNVTLPAYLRREPAIKRVGTAFTMVGYKPSDEEVAEYRRRFAMLLPAKSFLLNRSLYDYPHPEGRSPRCDSIIEGGSNLYVRDIYVNKLSPYSGDPESPYSYNLWEVSLDPNRNTPANQSEMDSGVTRAWAICADHNKLTAFLSYVKRIKDQGKDAYEITANWYGVNKPGDDVVQAWKKAFVSVFGKNACLATRQERSLKAVGYGYKAVDLSNLSRAFLQPNKIVITDEEVIVSQSRRLSTGVTLIDDDALPPRAQNLLKFFRWLKDELFAATTIKEFELRAGEIPDDETTGNGAVGICDHDARLIVIRTSEVFYFNPAMSVFIHEAAHAWGGPSAGDLTQAHAKAMTQIAARIADIMYYAIKTQSNKEIWDLIANASY